MKSKIAWSANETQLESNRKGISEIEQHISGDKNKRMSLEELDNIANNVIQGYRWRHEIEMLIAEVRIGME